MYIPLWTGLFENQLCALNDAAAAAICLPYIATRIL